jgi:hypothetical protein
MSLRPAVAGGHAAFGAAAEVTLCFFALAVCVESFLFRLAHLFDTMVMVDPNSFGTRLEAAGLTDQHVVQAGGAFRFRARRPSTV